jgi:hypothetical protein
MKAENTYGKKQNLTVEEKASQMNQENVIQKEGKEQLEQKVNQLKEENKYSEQQTVV